MVNGSEWGFAFDNVKVDWKKVIRRSRDITGKMNKGVAFLFKKNKVDHVEGHAKIVSGRTPGGPCRVEVSEPVGDYYRGTGGAKRETLTAPRVIIATGAAVFLQRLRHGRHRGGDP